MLKNNGLKRLRFFYPVIATVTVLALQLARPAHCPAQESGSNLWAETLVI